MATFQRIKLSGSNLGMAIPISGSTSGTSVLLHSSGASGATGKNFDEIHLWAANNTSGSRSVTLEYGYSGSANEIKFGVPALQGLFYVAPGLILQNDGASGNVKAFAELTGGSVLMHGYVNRITEE
jgi:hypothetical protein